MLIIRISPGTPYRQPQCNGSALKRREDACALQKLRKTGTGVLAEFRTKCFGSARRLRIAFIAST